MKRAQSAIIALALFICVLEAINSPAAVHYVDANGTNATPPYTNWGTAAVTIQDAVDAAVTGDEIVVTNGVYDAGVRVVYYDYNVHGAIFRVAVTTPMTVRSVNGPAVTSIVGSQDQDAPLRCVYLTNGTLLAGFTLTNGTTPGMGVGSDVDRAGGGVVCQSSSAIVSNCVLVGNSASSFGGGAVYGTLILCTLTNNRAWWDDGGGARGATLVNCTLSHNQAAEGGGASNCTLTNCVLSDNSAIGYHNYFYTYGYGGGAFESELTDCTVSNNGAYAVDGPCGGKGGGVYGGTLNNCMVISNWAGSTLSTNSESYGGGAYSAVLNHCALIGNDCASKSSYSLGGGAYSGALTNCTLIGNSASSGGGASSGTLINCTLSGNSALWGGGTDWATLINCIVYYNSASDGPNYDTDSDLNYTCTTPMPTNGVGNITNAALFVNTNGWSNLHLQTNSPGINAGNNDYVTATTDLDGNPRIAGGTVDMGAYEFQPCITGGQFGSVACSRLAGFSFTFSGAIVGQPYRIQTSTNLAAGIWTDLTNFTYTGPIIITDPSAVAGPKKFYRAVSP